MRTLKLTENDCTFVHYVLRMYAQQTPGLDSEDKEEIYEVAAKFKIIDKELAIFDRSIVATPGNRERLDQFAQANNGANDVLLTQMAVQLGYITALKFIKDEINS